MGLTVNRQINIFFFNSFNFFLILFNTFKCFLNNFLKFLLKQLLMIGSIPVFKYEQNYVVLLKLTAKFVIQIRVINVSPKN